MTRPSFAFRRRGVVMTNIIAFPPIKPPFLEVVPEAVDGYTHVVRYRDERYRSRVFRRCMSKREALALARDHGGFPVPGFAAERR
jgi:hypothetical protein